MCEGAAEGGGGLLSRSEEQWCVCAQSLGKEGHKHRFRRTGSRGSCGCRSAKDAGQLERADWLPVAGGRVLAAAFFLSVILNEKSDDSSGAGCLMPQQIPGVDIQLRSCLLADLGPGKTLFVPVLLSNALGLEKRGINQ